MARTPAFIHLRRLLRAAQQDSRAIPELPPGGAPSPSGATRRRFLGRGAAALAMGAAAAAFGMPAAARPAGAAGLDVAVVGAGLAGLACADALAQAGVASTLYDAAGRAGGRQYTLRGFFPGQVAERGGEFIDTGHKTLIGYARRFGLTLEDVGKLPGEVFYHFGGVRVPEAAVVDEFRAFVEAMRADLRRLSGEVTARAHTAADAEYDRTSLAAYLDGANRTSTRCGPLARAAIEQAYIAEYGLAIDQQSCLNFLFFVHGDRRSKFTPFGVFSDERYHVVEGNDRIAGGLAAGLPGPLLLGHRLARLRRAAGGGIEATFDTGARRVARVHDAVVVAIPFTVLRGVDLDASLQLPPEKLRAIRELGYGTNAKTMVGFGGRPWEEQGGNGSAYSDLPDLQATWETNPARAAPRRALLTDYSGAERGARLNRGSLDAAVAAFVADLDRVYPGAAAGAVRSDGGYLAHLEHWPSNPLTLGSYTCYTPGQFTTIAGWEGTAVGNLLFAGEHTDSFYNWQGFMEGAALSGLRAAQEVLKPGRS